MGILSALLTIALVGTGSLDPDANLTTEKVAMTGTRGDECNGKSETGSAEAVTATLICENVQPEPDWESREFILHGNATMAGIDDQPRLFAVWQAASVVCPNAFEEFVGKPIQDASAYISKSGSRLGFNLGERVMLQNFCRVYSQGYADGLDWAFGKRTKIDE